MTIQHNRLVINNLTKENIDELHNLEYAGTSATTSGSQELQFMADAAEMPLDDYVDQTLKQACQNVLNQEKQTAILITKL